jgi:hypothetical protein
LKRRAAGKFTKAQSGTFPEIGSFNEFWTAIGAGFEPNGKKVKSPLLPSLGPSERFDVRARFISGLVVLACLFLDGLDWIALGGIERVATIVTQ